MSNSGAVGASASRSTAGSTQDFVTAAVTIGAIAAGVALFEVALIPGLMIGGAAALAPRYLPRLRRSLQPLIDAAVRHATPAAPPPAQPNDKLPLALPARFGIGQALAKTITFRIIVTTLDFGANYLIIGELGTAAGLSAFALVVGPVFYFVHEAAWNYVAPPIKRGDGLLGVAVDLPLPFLRGEAKAPAAGRNGFVISRAIAKTITFRTVATAMDFTATYVVVGDLATAAALSAVGFVAGPFVYLGHEMAWDYYGAAKAPAAGPLATPRLPRSASAATSAL